MKPEISGSVGRWEKGARNLQADVKIVQGLLRGAAKTLKAPEIDPKGWMERSLGLLQCPIR
jgi:hypothetical protein